MSGGLERRRLLRAGAAGLTAGLTGLSGCGLLSGGGGDSRPTETLPDPETATDSPTPTGTPTPDSRAADRIEAASEALVANNDAFATFADRVRSLEQSTPESFDAAAVRDRVGTAESDLSTAAGVATDEQLTTIEAMRNLAVAQRPAATFFARYATISQQYSRVDRLEDQERYGEALSQLDTVDETILTGNEPIDDTVSAFEFVQGDELSTVAVEFTRLQTAFETLRARYDLLDSMSTALRPFLRGVQEFQRAAAAFENQRYPTAAAAFGNAESHFREARGAFRGISLDDVNLETPPGFESDLEQTVCTTDAFTTGAGFLAGSAQAYADGETERARELAQQGQYAVQQCETTPGGA
jgi:hypothetical protein